MPDKLPLSYFISLGVLTALLAVTFAVTAVFLFTEAQSDPKARRFSKMVSEKGQDGSGEAVSYSRVAGVLGAMALTGLFICGTYWVHHALFTGAALTNLSELWPLFAMGSALFAPYAFNRVSQIGK